MKRRRIWISIGLWTGLYLSWVTLFGNQVFSLTRTMTVQFCYLLFIAGAFYLQLYYSIPRLLYRKKYGLFALFLPATIGVSALLRTLLAVFLQRHYFRPVPVPAPGFDAVFRESLLNIFIWVICLVAGRLVFERVRFHRYIDSIEKEKTRNELDFLRAQFNPHFLFNSINSIYGHIDRRNGKARTMLLSFSEMLRYQLYECNVDSVGIDKEIQYIRNYIALQQERKEENLFVSLDIPENVRGFTIAPLLLIAFIENAFKYVSCREDRENKVMISLCKKGDHLQFRAFNTREEGTGRPRMDKGGIGIVNVKRRLELQYPERYELQIRDEKETYEIILNLKIEPHVIKSHYSR